jgi:AcrR family transcriptional regulator
MAGRKEGVMVVPTGRHGLPADVVAEHQRERLLVATIELVAERGYQGTTIDQIVKAAKVGYVAFYELFAGKEECFLAAFDRIVAELDTALVAAVPEQAPWPEQICAAITALIDLVAADPVAARVGLVEVLAAGPAALARYQVALDTAIPKLREGRRLGAGAEDLSETLEQAILGGIAWILHQRLVIGEADRVGELRGEAIEIALSPYLGEAEARRHAGAAVAVG